jgi:hypothetical protein
MPTPLQQATNLGNGHGMIYFTGPSGTFPATASEGQYPQSGLPNGLIGKNAAINVGHNAKNAAYDTPATWTLEMTNAAADNLTVFKIGGRVLRLRTKELLDAADIGKLRPRQEPRAPSASSGGRGSASSATVCSARTTSATGAPRSGC